MTDIPTQAAEWLVKLSSEDPAPTAEDFAEFERWKNADPSHQDAVTVMEGLLGKLQTMPAQPATVALEHAHLTRNTDTSWSGLAKALCLFMLVFLPLCALYWQPPAVLFADRRTGTGEWQEIRLPDNSLLRLSSNSAVDIEFNQQKRLISLIQGDILLDVAKDKSRAFIVETRQGRFTALGTRFTVQHRDESHSTLTVIESRVKAKHTADQDDNSSTLNQKAGVILQQDQRILLDQQGYGAIQTIDAMDYEQAWHNRQLIVEGIPMSEVLEQLAPFYPGYLSYDAAQLSRYKVYAVLPLDEPQRALQLLSESFPVSINEIGPWFVQIKSQ